MPEKPEVVTVANTLKRQVLGKVITDCQVFWDNIIAYPTVDEFKKEIKNQKILDITTRGKWIVFELSRDLLLVHLRMEGKFFFRNVDDSKNKHEHVFFTLDSKISFRFHDVRKFGKMYLLDKKEAYTQKPLNELVYEYDDSQLDENYLYQKIHSKKLPIKTLLLDQSIITGIGNIYDEFNKRGLKSKMLIQVHDELVFNVLDSELEEVSSIVRDIMEHTIELSVPLKVDIEYGDNWYEAK